jgi:hypothetical protein
MSAARYRELASQFRTLAACWRLCAELARAELCELRASFYDAEAERAEALR